MKKFITLGAASASLFVLTACQPGSDITQKPVNFTMKNEASAKRIVKHNDLDVRTYVRKGSKHVEIKGARCNMESAEMSATFITPATVNFPVFKAKPTRLRIDCVANDSKFSQTVIPKMDGTAIGAASPVGLLAAVVSTAIVAGRNHWSYVVPRLLLKEDAEAKTTTITE